MAAQTGVTGVRARARAELTAEIKRVARRHVAEGGSAALSLRAVARDVGMVSSAVYRYFPSRDDLLTALIIDAYTASGTAVTEAERAVPRARLRERWLVAAKRLRAWALAEPHEYALIYGSPVPGYAAPRDTVDPATMVPLVLLGIVGDASAAGIVVGDPERSIPRSLRAELATLRRQAAPALATSGLAASDLPGSALPDSALAAAIMAWTQLIGAISFELFGHLHNVIVDYDTWFDFAMRSVATDLGLPR